jgi:hypothetical protein
MLGAERQPSYEQSEFHEFCFETIDLTVHRKQKELFNPGNHTSGELPAVGASADNNVQLISILCWSALQLER